MKTEQYINVIKACLNHSIEIEMYSNGHLKLMLIMHAKYGTSHITLQVKHKRIASSVISALGSLGTFTVLEGSGVVMCSGYVKPYRRIATLEFSIP